MPAISYPRQLIRNTSWTLLDLGLYPLLMVIATPLFINRLGASQYGLWMLVNTFIQGIHILNFGLGDSTIRQVSYLRGSGGNGIRQALLYNIRLASLICAAGIGISYAVTGSDTFFSLFNLAQYREKAATLLLFGSIAGGLKFFELVSMGFYKGCERFDIAARFSLLSRCSGVLVNIGLVLGGGELEDIFRSLALTALCNVLLQYFFMFSYMHKIIHTDKQAAPVTENVAEPRHYLWYWLQSAIALAGFLSDKFLVAHFTGLDTLGYYSIASLVGIQVHNMLLSLGAFVFPRISFLQAQGVPGHDVQRAASFLLNSFGWLILGVLLLSGDTLFGWWLGEETCRASLPYIRLYLVFECAIILIIIPYHYINGTRQIRWNSFFELLLRGCHFAGMIIGYRLAGSAGLIWGLFCATLLNLPFQYFIFHRKILHEQNLSWLTVPLVPLLFAGLLLGTSLLLQLLLLLLIILCVKLFYYNPARFVIRKLRYTDPESPVAH